jgi:hypothetical protein
MDHTRPATSLGLAPWTDWLTRHRGSKPFRGLRKVLDQAGAVSDAELLRFGVPGPEPPDVKRLRSCDCLSPDVSKFPNGWSAYLYLGWRATYARAR